MEEKCQKLVDFEVGKFREYIGNTLTGKEPINEVIDRCMSKALFDAIGQGARSRGEKYKEIKDDLFEVFRAEFKDVCNGKRVFKDQGDYERFFKGMVGLFKKTMASKGLRELGEFGFAQKFVSMSFKYLYCFDACNKENLKYCYLPFDKYSLRWYSSFGKKELLERLKKINYVWSNIDPDLFFAIQDDIDSKLEKKEGYPINCADETETVELPAEKLAVDFIIWKQQYLEEIYGKLEKLKKYFKRLGIQEIEPSKS